MKSHIEKTTSALALALIMLFVNQAMPVLAEGGIPSTSTTDGKFVGLAGDGLQTLTSPSKYWVSVQSGQISFNLDVFDGDLGGLWDSHDPMNSVQTEFLLYADPLKSGNSDGKPLVTASSSVSMTNNAWTTIYNGPAHSSARAPSGNYFYLLVVRWTIPSRSANEFNGFKLRGGTYVSLTPGQWAFVGAPINLGSDPPLRSQTNSYDGRWNWHVFTPQQIASLRFTDCDADARTNTAAPGDPPDDFSADQRILISPDVNFTILRPDGQPLVTSQVPSGNILCETRNFTVTQGGTYQWNWNGVDAHNLIFIDSEYEMMSGPGPLLPVNPEPTATPTSTRTPTPVPSVTPSPTRTPLPSTATPVPAPQEPEPIATPYPLPTVAPTTQAPTTTPTTVATTVPTPSPTMIMPTLLPRTGGGSILNLLIIGGVASIFGSGVVVLIHFTRERA